MEIIRIIKNKNYTTVCNELFRDVNISLKAKGLLGLLLSLPPDWDLSIAGLSSISKEGRRAIASTITELIENGYILREPLRDGTKFNGYSYTVYESKEMPKCGFAETGTAETQSEEMQNSTQISNNIINDLNNKEKKKGRFKKPTLNEIINYIDEKGSFINPQSFFNHYQSNGWKVGKNPMKCWKSAIASWEARDKNYNNQSKVAMRANSHNHKKGTDYKDGKF